MRLSIVIPARNEGATIGQVLKELRGLEIPGVETEIIVVDDGSSDRTVAIARLKRARVVTHLINRGLGGALGTGIAAALESGADLIVTFDADGQHAAHDIPTVVQPLIMHQADVVIGSRMLGERGMPWARRLANHVANLLTLVMFQTRVTDSQSGLRAFSRFAASLIRITASTYEVSSEICGEIHRHRLRLAEVPIRPIYTEYSLSKGQSFMMGLKTLFRLLLWIGERSR